MAATAMVLCLAAPSSFAQWRQQDGNTTADLRGLCAVNAQIVWASGAHGSFTRTTDGGGSWRSSTVADAAELDFRDVEAFDANTAYLLSAGKGPLSRIYKTTDGGLHWTGQYVASQADAFFDAMAFWDRDHGIALGDPVDGRFLIIVTEDGGRTWSPVPAAHMPPAVAGEGAFAASGTCIAVQGANRAWFVTGGGAARVFRSDDRGKNWSVTAAPITGGAANVDSAGIFSIAFGAGSQGVIVGGDYRKPNSAGDNTAITTDGGRTWTLSPGRRPAGYRSGAAFAGPMTVIAVGTSGSDLSMDGGRSWMPLDTENYNSVAARDGVAWAVGPKGRIARLVTLPDGRKLAGLAGGNLLFFPALLVGASAVPGSAVRSAGRLGLLGGVGSFSPAATPPACALAPDRILFAECSEYQRMPQPFI